MIENVRTILFVIWTNRNMNKQKYEKQTGIKYQLQKRTKAKPWITSQSAQVHHEITQATAVDWINFHTRELTDNMSILPRYH